MFATSSLFADFSSEKTIDSIVDHVIDLVDPGILFTSCLETQSLSSSSKVVCNTSALNHHVGVR